MRKLIENPVYMSMDDMKETFKGKWIYIAKCNMAEGYDLVGGVPVVVADAPYEGDIQFYKQFDGEDFSPRCHRNFNRKAEFFFPTYPPDENEVFECLTNSTNE